MAKPKPKPKPQTPSGDNASHTVAEVFNAVLADSFALYLKTKNFHWHVSGPFFLDYHNLFDAQAGEIIGTTDAIAERVRKMGNRTLRSIGDITRHQRIKDNNATSVTLKEMLQELLDDNLLLVASRRFASRAQTCSGRNRGQRHQRHC